MTASTQHKLGPDDGRRADFPALANRYLIESASTDGRFALVEHTIGPRKLAAPMHKHEREDEYSFVLSGLMGAQIGDDVVEAGPGELVFKPRGIPHAFWNPGDQPTHILELISPGDFAEYFTELAPTLQAMASGGEPDFERMGEIRARYALEMDMDSIPRLMQEHGLET